MCPFQIDAALYHYLQHGRLSGLSRTYVDNITPAGDRNFRQTSNLTLKCSQLQKGDELPAGFTGFISDRGKKKDGWTDQGPYFTKLECLPL